MGGFYSPKLPGGAPAMPGLGVAVPQGVSPLEVRALAEAQELDILRQFGTFLALATVFIRFSYISETISYSVGASTYLLYLVVPPSLLAVLLSGGFGRTFRAKGPVLLFLFFFWLVLATPFSHWPGGSFGGVVKPYAYTVLPMLPIVAGLIITWGDVRKFMYAVALGGVVALGTARLFGRTSQGRLELEYAGSIGNANDLAAHLLLVLPFLLFVVLDGKRNVLLRGSVILVIIYGFFMALSTASRGAVVAMLAMGLFWLIRASMTQRVLLVVLGLVISIGLFPVLPDQTKARILSLFGEDYHEAEASADSREYVFRQSLIFTYQHPFLGVGPGQFGNYEGHVRVSEGQRGSWHSTHCTWTQVSSEAGIPALLFYVGALGSAFFLALKTNREARRLGYQDIANASFCFLLGFVGYFSAITFLSNSYGYYQPVLVGFGTALHFAAKREMELRQIRAGSRR
jgi:O-antigen ligase